MNSLHLLHSPNSGESFYFRDRIPTDLLEHFGGVKEFRISLKCSIKSRSIRTSKILDRNLVIVTGAVRDEGVSPRIVPISYPAIPAIEIVRDIESASEGQDSVHKGIVLSTDLFYPHKILGSNMKLWQESGVVAVEMECSILFVIASLHGIKSGAILAIDGNPLAKNDEEMSEYNPYRSVVKETVDIALKIALDALISGHASLK